MFKSLFSKFIGLYTAIILTTFLLLSVLLSSAIQNYFIEQKQEMMLEQGRIIRDQYALQYYTGFMDKKKLGVQLELIDKYLNARIWLVDTTGKIYMDSRTAQDARWIGQQISVDVLKTVLEGEVVTIRGKFGESFTEPVLTVGYPIIVNYQVMGALFLHASIPMIQETVSYVFRLILLCLMISLLVAFIFVYMLSRKIIKPLNEMNHIAKAMAEGDFKKRIIVDSEDEVGELANSFNNMAEELSQLEELRKGFLANISHDFRSPLTSIKGFIQAILDGTIPTEYQEKYLTIVLEETERLTKLTNEILDLTYMESENMDLEKSNFDLHALIRQMVMQFEQRIKDKQIDFKLVLQQEVLWVYGDSDKIKRVLYNLIDNAIKFVNEKDQIVIDTSIHGNKAYISIQDTGPGMSKEELQHIWDRFHKGDRSRGKDKKGTGLGLSIVKQIIKHHGEEVFVESEEDVGTTFVFTLPLAEKSEE
ncbi:MAG: HAMP domain-containing histidine kinase [Epulopiscium sp.]|nr:HAMP domain-containing histidine kinase [Candidatus Epulonipiscium sp.]